MKSVIRKVYIDSFHKLSFGMEILELKLFMLQNLDKKRNGVAVVGHGVNMQEL
ncbi:hypothetical protein Hs30E_18420 [Lactococcus hodotermopsidis]|uniref:Uncharacterized protein n=1 Tax=Pseudolactococcus hodotermopsidis TaxID=2709157 RepID=A0A6A0BGA0_9LACT|nr:hypothetical protein Hs30E_18420 [Lactococcus hodotermopsidis]